MFDPSKAGMFQGPPVVPRIGGTAASYVPLPAGSDSALRRFQLGQGLHVAGGASESNPWLGLVQALNAHMAARQGGVGYGGQVGGGNMFGVPFGGGYRQNQIPSRRTIYGPGPRAF